MSNIGSISTRLSWSEAVQLVESYRLSQGVRNCPTFRIQGAKSAPICSSVECGSWRSKSPSCVLDRQNDRNGLTDQSEIVRQNLENGWTLFFGSYVKVFEIFRLEWPNGNESVKLSQTTDWRSWKVSMNGSVTIRFRKSDCVSEG